MWYSLPVMSLGPTWRPFTYTARALSQPSSSRAAYATASTACQAARLVHSTRYIDGVRKTRDENAKEFSCFISSVNVIICNPWHLWEKGFTKLWIQGRDGSKVEAKGKYDEPRVHLMDYNSLPDGIRNRLDVSDRLEWMCHPLPGYLLKVFLDAFELGRVWGSIILERQIKPNAGYYYAHDFMINSLTCSAYPRLWNLPICFGE